MTKKHWLLVIVLVVTNLGWAVAYRDLWYASAQVEGLLEQAEAYITPKPEPPPCVLVPKMTPLGGHK